MLLLAGSMDSSQPALSFRDILHLPADQQELVCQHLLHAAFVQSVSSLNSYANAANDDVQLPVEGHRGSIPEPPLLPMRMAEDLQREPIDSLMRFDLAQEWFSSSSSAQQQGPRRSARHNSVEGEASASAHEPAGQERISESKAPHAPQRLLEDAQRVFRAAAEGLMADTYISAQHHALVRAMYSSAPEDQLKAEAAAFVEYLVSQLQTMIPPSFSSSYSWGDHAAAFHRFSTEQDLFDRWQQALLGCGVTEPPPLALLREALQYAISRVYRQLRSAASNEHPAGSHPVKDPDSIERQKVRICST